MTRLSIAPASADDARIGGFLDRQKRRVDAMPPGMCPLAQQLTLLEEGALQTCGKCVPCRDGLPQLAGMLRHLVDCKADAAEVERMRALAEMVRHVGLRHRLRIGKRPVGGPGRLRRRG